MRREESTREGLPILSAFPFHKFEKFRSASSRRSAISHMPVGVSQMAGFSDTVDSLLETYSKCLSLLKGLKGPGNNDQPRQLRKCIRSDRSKVRQIYSSRLSLNGSQLEKGDAVARSSLRRVIKRLTSAMTRLLRVMTRAQDPVIDYQSLRTLSNSSRIDAVKTINDLSRRLSTPSIKSSSGARETSKRQKRTKSPGKISKPNHEKSARVKSGQGEEDRPTVLPALTAGPRPISQVDPKKRISMATMSSGSTKLGEIVPNKLRRRQSNKSAVSDEFNIQPTYPLRPYHPETKRKKFWGLFGRG